MQIRTLKDRAVAALKAPGLYSDGGGLYIQVGKTGARSWIFRYKRDGRQRLMGLGPYPLTSLAVARTRADAARALRAQGIDPLEDKLAKNVSLGARSRAAKSADGRSKSTIDVPRGPITFKQTTDEYIAKFVPSLTNAKHRAQWKATLYAEALPTMGSLPVATITRQHVLNALRPIWWEKPETASRVRGRIEKVLDLAIAEGHHPGPNPALWAGLKGALPDKGKLATVKHHGAMQYKDVPTFVQELRELGGLPALAFELLILTAVRTRELLLAEHEEFDLSAAVWTIPSTRMKIKKQGDHRIPLAPRAIDLVRQAMTFRRADEPLLFPGRVKMRPFSDMVFLMTLRRLNKNGVTAHGFRSAFKDWAIEETEYDDLLSEEALAHHVGSKVRRSYARGDMLDRRRALMGDWANYIEPNLMNAGAPQCQPKEA